MPDRAVSLLVGTSYLDTIKPDQVGQAAALLASHGLAEASHTLLEGGKPELRLHRDAGAVVALCSTGLAAPWRLTDVTWPPGGPACDPGLRYAPARAVRTGPAPPALLKLDNHNLLALAEDGTWHLAGWACTIVGSHVRDAWKAELAAPGGHRTTIAGLRHATRTAPPVPAGMQVHGVEAMDPRTRRAWDGILMHYGATATSAGWHLAVTPALAGSLIYNLDQKHLSWLVPSLDAPPHPRLAPADAPPGPGVRP